MGTYSELPRSKGTKGHILGSVGAVVRQRMEKGEMAEVETEVGGWGEGGGVEGTNRQEA